MNCDANTAFARCVVDEWSRGGVTDAVLSPGSRSTPLALALAYHDGITLHVHLDERSASFFALGLAKGGGRPVIVLCTSGTAAANFHPAVLEAAHARVPLVVCTADRPPEFREVGAAQTVDQTNLYGKAVRWYFEPETPSERDAGPEAWAVWRSLAARSLAEAQGSPPGPVHLNLPFREPLVPPSPTDVPFDLGARPEQGPWQRATRSPRVVGDEATAGLARRISGTPRGVLLAGWGASVAPATLERLARASGWPILADPLSGVRTGPFAISAYDALSRVDKLRESLRPDLVLRVGSPLTSKATMTWLATSATVTFDPQRSWSDPQRAAEFVLDVEPEPVLAELADRVANGDESWISAWIHAEDTARQVIDAELDSWPEPFEGRVARDVMACLPDDARLVVASSMPVRDLESFARPRRGVTVLANRGVNGIDGFVSSVLGVAASGAGPVTVALLGDLCLLHDANGLLGARGRGCDAVFVVLDNNGGGIFSFLPQAGLPDHFEELFGTPQGVDIAELGAVYGVPVTDVERADQLVPAVEAAIAAGGVRIVRVRTERSANALRHALVFRAVAEVLGE
ncbi:MAG TPA: 2-succinyl-5-enolpyruvyl-6-hydroxy-3-cyclohexene-1-carboxylic-acid synthase [Acidimicrobiales bacterium]|nr:2-succinyl-5-enolpyruvyl-6-hydroxy-3-cyclohexene-1-carboxylic-acid synthase [Acidimicrobiales bacterium]